MFLACKSLAMQFRNTLSLDCYISFPSRHMLDLSRNRTWEAIDSPLPLKKCHQSGVPENIRHIAMNCI